MTTSEEFNSSALIQNLGAKNVRVCPKSLCFEEVRHHAHSQPRLAGCGNSENLYDSAFAQKISLTDEPCFDIIDAIHNQYNILSRRTIRSQSESMHSITIELLISISFFQSIVRYIHGRDRTLIVLESPSHTSKCTSP